MKNTKIETSQNYNPRTVDYNNNKLTLIIWIIIKHGFKMYY